MYFLIPFADPKSALSFSTKVFDENDGTMRCSRNMVLFVLAITETGGIEGRVVTSERDIRR